jgi:FAD/FMN-containing dehydrogenase
VRTVTERELAQVVGAANVISDETVLGSYAGDHSFVGKILPRFVARVDSREAVQKLVDLARETATPLVPVSSGGPHFTATPSPPPPAP